MPLKRLSAVILVLAGLFVQTAFSQSTLTVAKSGAMHTTVQAAVNAAKSGDVIEIIDLGIYDEQVTVDSTKSGITIRSRNPLNRGKPIIRYQDTTNRSPKNPAEVQNPALARQFETCGALRILGAYNITIDGIIVDGGVAAPFAWHGVWEYTNPLFHGNAAITIVKAGNTVIRNSELRFAYFGIHVKDRNIGGAFGFTDIGNSQNDIVRLSGFGQTGNHLFEYNRIHTNSVGVYFESSWDLGSTVRYNLIFNNFHQSITNMPNIAQGEQTAGGIGFKNNYLSPVAIYNNTFYNNNMNFMGNWQVGAQHLIFNNILGRSNRAQGTDPNLSHFDLTPRFRNRLHNSVMSAQKSIQLQTQNIQVPFDPSNICGGDAPVTLIMGPMDIINGIEGVPATQTQFAHPICPEFSQSFNSVAPGTLVPTFPNGNVRWLQVEGFTQGALSLPLLFQSVNPENNNFLHPNWEHPQVTEFILGKGWAAPGMFDGAGELPDLGAVQSRARQNTVARITPTGMVMVNGTSAEVKFAVNVEKGQLNNPAVTFIRWISPISDAANNWGNNAEIIPAASIMGTGTTHPITVPPGTVLHTDGRTNTINFTLPTAPSSSDNQYGFFEIVIEGIDASGNKVTTDIGFLPFRTLRHRLEIMVFPPDGPMTEATALREVVAGLPVRIRVQPVEIGTGVSTPLSTLNLSLLSDPVQAQLRFADTHQPLTQLTNLSVTGGSPYVANVYFTRAGEETISAAASAAAAGSQIAFHGTANIKVNAGYNTNRLYMFFSDDKDDDTDVRSYHNPQTGINALTDTRVRAAIKAANSNGRVIDSDYTVCVSASRSDSSIEFYEHEDSSEPIGAGQISLRLNRGKGVVWVSSAVDVSNICITAAEGTCGFPAHSIFASEPRCGVSFTAPGTEVPKLVSANSFYSNISINGSPVNFVNFLSAEFTTPVIINWLDSLHVKFSGTNITAGAKVSEITEAIEIFSGRPVIGVNLPLAFPDVFGGNAAALRNLTGGNMELTVTFNRDNSISEHWDNITAVINDKAAPVLVFNGDLMDIEDDSFAGAVLRVGRSNKDGSFDRDTLIVIYSEELRSSFKEVKHPLLFERWDDGERKGAPALTFNDSRIIDGSDGRKWHEAVYLVPEGGFGFTSGPYLTIWDSVSINPSAPYIADLANNEQKSANKRIAVRIQKDGRLLSKREAPGRKVPPQDEIPALSITSGEFTAGPNPADRKSGVLNFFYQGTGINHTKLSIYDASGNLVRKINIRDNSGKTEKRIVAAWDLKDSRRRTVSEGTYVVRGTLITKDGKRERISLLIGVR
ncbi:MAG: hypothetical protein FWE57_09495 [Chitinispirillia bacterium]|nr:hypothetical protein [Chitinispirillia bacterium]